MIGKLGSYLNNRLKFIYFFCYFVIILTIFICANALGLDQSGNQTLPTNIYRLLPLFCIGGLFNCIESYTKHYSLCLTLALSVIAIFFYGDSYFMPFYWLSLTFIVFNIAYCRHTINLPFDYSYGIYLYSFPIQQIVIQYQFGQSPILNFLIALPLTLIVAMLSWEYIEKPLINNKIQIYKWFYGKFKSFKFSSKI